MSIIFSWWIDKIFAAVCEEVLFTGAAAGGGGDLPRVDVHAVLSLLGERDAQRYNVPRHFLRHILWEFLLLEPVLV